MRRQDVPYQPRFLTFSCRHRLPLFDEDWIKGLFVDALDRARRGYGFRLLAWVIMPEHAHLVVVPPLGPGLGVPLRGIKQRVARAALSRWRDEFGIDRFWQPGGGFDRNVRDAEKLEGHVRYIHRNPVERGLVLAPTDWPWSSARWYAGRKDTLLDLDGTR